MPLPPGPRTPAPLQLLSWVLRPLPFLEGARARFGTPLTLRMPGWGAFVMLTDPAAVKDVFTGDPRVLHSGEANEFLAESLGPSSLLVLDDEPHERQRRALLPPFHGERMKAHAAHMRDATLERVRRWRPGATVRLEEECREIALQVILRTVFGIEGADELEGFAPRVRAFMRMAGSPFGLLAQAAPARLRPLAWAPYLRLQRAVTGPLLARIRAGRGGAADGTSVLATLLGMTHEDGLPLSDEELRDHMLTLLLAGHDTSAVALAWAFLDLLHAPEALARVRAELRAAFPDGVVVTDGLARLPFLDAVVRESLRLHPTVPFVVRRLKRPFVAGGREYPEGTMLAPCMLLAHSDPRLYDEPRAFRPERFLEARPDPYRWYPFGGGTRRCIGMAFALFEMRVVLATVLTSVELRAGSCGMERVRRRGILLAPARRARATVAGPPAGPAVPEVSGPAAKPVG